MPSSRLQVRRHLLFWVFASSAAVIAGASSPAVVARWHGGELSRDVFHARYDPDGRAAAQGGWRLDEAISKAVFQEIYVERAKALGLDRSPELASELSSWRERNLAAAWRRAHQPDFAAAATPEVVRAYYAEHAQSLYLAAGRLDIEVLFLKCSLRTSERAACREHAAGLDARLAAGETFAALVAEQRRQGSTASGHFPDFRLGELTTDLETVVAATEVGALTPWVEMPHGLFRFHVLAHGADRKSVV